MYTLETLPLFNQETSHFNIENVPQNSEKKQTIEAVAPDLLPTIKSSEKQKTESELISTLVNKFFPDYKSERDITHIEKIIRSLLYQYTGEELEAVLTEIQYLCESALEEYEKEIFKGKTLNELLNNLL
ncbi:hypothetical protein KAZ66_04705 [Candidatus Woesebacteria bacterium]|nr:hypothetical protein [Candidatus Woesebacteria bacterium]